MYSNEFLDSCNWKIEKQTSNALPGAFRGHSQELNRLLHPCLNLPNTMVHVPEIEPVEYLLWHCDSKCARKGLAISQR